MLRVFWAALMLAISIAVPAAADLKICNKSGEKRTVAIGYKDDGIWSSQGWWVLENNECAVPLAGDLKSRYYYYRAEDFSGGFDHEGYGFCTNPQAFTIVGDQDCGDRNFQSKGFAQIDTGPTARTFTFTIEAIEPDGPGGESEQGAASVAQGGAEPLETAPDAPVASQGSSVSDSERRLALVIGNSIYQNAPALLNPGNDARDIADALRGLGYEVTLALDLDRGQMVDALGRFAVMSYSSDHAVVYYAGHGMELNKNNYLIPVDAELLSDLSVSYETIGLDQVLGAVSGAKRLALVILDACRDNPFANTMTRTLSSRSISRGLVRAEPTQANMLIAYSAKEGTVAYDGQGKRNSPYARALIDTILEPGVEIGQVFRRVRDRVLSDTDGLQEPFHYASLSADPIYLNLDGQ